MNKVILIGRLTRDPELSTTPGGISVCKLSIAVDRKFKSADGDKVTDFFNIVAWRQLGENIHRYQKKGNKICVIGELQTRSYEDKNGNNRTVTEVVAGDVEFLTPKEDGQKADWKEADDTDDLPF